MKEPSIKIIESFVKKPEKLFECLRDSIKWDERMKARKTASFGLSYDYSGITYPQAAMHSDLEPLY
ncbi:hypothetical protein H0A36_07290 [Endozoicomonas sp. SM1973]|uniref:Uncharacterized protein n=1 Tax=Spartinivicinus marinus TaxID=2994442 RepID=A0A853I6S5_9GAMM|nr:hypothetical protein [Spartinivicinus marinus]MCX4029277.1 hypothetical protein [Spartinivicinus marinus]NYZ65814.1 hypothetical protein [Spartinivicinus marinus]